MKIVETYVRNSFRCLPDSKVETKESLVNYVVKEHDRNKLVLCKDGSVHEIEAPKKKRKVVRGNKEIDNQLAKSLDFVEEQFTYEILNNADTQLILRIDDVFSRIQKMNEKFINTRKEQSAGGRRGAAKKRAISKTTTKKGQ